MRISVYPYLRYRYGGFQKFRIVYVRGTGALGVLPTARTEDADAAQGRASACGSGPPAGERAESAAGAGSVAGNGIAGEGPRRRCESFHFDDNDSSLFPRIRGFRAGYADP